MMAYVYAQLIIKGFRKFKDIDPLIKEEVRKELTALGREDLIIE